MEIKLEKGLVIEISYEEDDDDFYLTEIEMVEGDIVDLLWFGNIDKVTDAVKKELLQIRAERKYDI